jgi:hypothetical protein
LSQRLSSHPRALEAAHPKAALTRLCFLDFFSDYCKVLQSNGTSSHSSDRLTNAHPSPGPSLPLISTTSSPPPLTPFLQHFRRTVVDTGSDLVEVFDVPDDLEDGDEIDWDVRDATQEDRTKERHGGSGMGPARSRCAP